MSELIEHIFKESSIPISEFSKEMPIILLDENGIILDCIITKSNQDGAHELLSVLVSRNKNIRDIFLLPENLTIDNISKLQPKRYYPLLQKQHKTNEGIETYYTTFSLLWLRIFPGAEGRFIALIAMPRLLPNITERFTGGLFFVDKNDRLVLYNQSFYNNFAETAQSPFDLLGKNVGDFLQRAPKQIQDEALKTVHLPPLNAYKTIFEMDFTSPNINLDYMILPSSNVNYSTDGLEMCANTKNGSFASYSQPFEFKDDLRIVVKGYFNNSSLPCFILGELAETTLYRDANGYLIGPSSNGNSIIIKKAGYQIALSSIPQFTEHEENSVQLVKCGCAFYYYLNSSIILSFYDHDLLSREQTWISMYLREGQKCKIANWSAGVRTNNSPIVRESIFVELKNGSNSTFLMNRILSTYLASGMEDYEAYRLQDVTDFQQKVRNLENQYRSSLEKERNLERIVTRIKQQTGDFLGSGKATTALREMALRIAPSKATVLIQGETGSGKEILAHYVHNNSTFSKGPFVKVDCATIASTLMESILFGHEKGAFTGATGSTKGLFEQAAEGTLFLDEVNNLSMETQAKLLRFLNDQTIVRLGGQNPIKLNLRIIAASNRHLFSLVNQGLFRQDLYYRLAVAELFIPPLREQLENLPELCNHFLQSFCRTNSRHIKGFSPQALKKFFSHTWPGNVRELRNIVERAVLFCQGDTITDDLIDIKNSIAYTGAPDAKMRKPADFTEEEFTEAAKKHGGVLQRVAEEFGISRRALYYQLSKFGIDANSFRKNPRRRAK